MRHKLPIFALLSGIVSTAPAYADKASAREDPDTIYIGGGGLVPEAVAGVNPLLAPPSTTGLAAAVTPNTSGTQFSLTILPEKLGLRQPLTRGSTVTLAYDSKTSLTSLAANIVLFDPFSHSGERVSTIINLLTKHSGCGKKYLQETQAAADKKTRERIDAAIAVEEATTDDERERANARKTAVEAEWESATKAAKTARKECETALLAAEWSKIYGTTKPKVTFSAATGVFPAGRGVDPITKDMGVNAPLEPFQGISGELRLLFRPRQTLSLEVWGTLRNTRPSGGPRTRRSLSEGAGATFALLVWRFADKKELIRTPHYVSSGFIPGVGVGASLQSIRCEGGPYCENGKVRSHSLTPFIDIRIKQDLQVRISLPIERGINVSSSNAVAITPTFTVAGTIAALK